MHLLKLYLMSVCCLASVNVLAYGLAIDNDSETSSSPSSVGTDQAKTSTTTTINTTNPKQTPLARKAIKSNKHSHILNKKLLNKLGLAKVRAPNSHNRKRLAVESRRHASPDDSHMFIIKLPPNLYYYTSPKAVAGAGADAVKGTGSSTGTNTATKNNALDQGNGKKVSFNFNSNGKPSRIYHWNLPVLKKILSDESRFPTLRSKDELIDIKNIPTWTKPWENETIEKSYGKSSLGEKKSLKRKSPSYYAPSNVVTKNSFKKYFPGNGKPKGFYVLKGNHNKKSATYYRNITP